MGHNDEKEFAKLASRIKIPLRPRVLTELKALFSGDNYDARAVSKIINKDPVLVAMLFKTVRSPVFGCGESTDSLEQVLMIIGVKKIYNLVQALSLSGSVSNKSRDAFELFWTRSQDVAQLSAIIAADHINTCKILPDDAYMTGMFHQCGIPVIRLSFLDYCAQMQSENLSDWPDIAQEDAKFNVDHCEIGYRVGRHWNLPDFVCAAIGHYREIPNDDLGKAKNLISILQTGIQFHSRIKNIPNPLWVKVGANALDDLGVPPDDELEYFEAVAERFKGA